MNPIVSIGVRSIIYWLIGTTIFLFVINFIQFPIAKLPQTDSLSQAISYEMANPKEMVLAQIRPSIEKAVSLEDTPSYFIFFDYVLENTNLVIPAFYLLMFISFILQVTLLAWSHYYLYLHTFVSKKQLDNIFLYSSEFAVNAPTVLGVMGTIFSFGVVVSMSADLANLSTMFKENFANSALTTIIGGMVYIMNLYLNIFISKNLAIVK